MPSLSPATVIIECPHCGTRYQVPAETIGSSGREVACAHCGQTWQAKAEAAPVAPPPPPAPAPQPARPAARDPDRMFDEAAERELDAAFEAAEAEEAAAGAMPVAAPSQPESAAPAAPAESAEPVEPVHRAIADIKASMAASTMVPTSAKLEAAKRNRRADAAMAATVADRSPLARLRRVVRVVAVCALLAVVAGGIVFRLEVVRAFPDMAGVYAAVGLGVNVVGLEFRDVSTLMTRQDGVDRLQVDGRIVSVASHITDVPSVVVAILGKDGKPIYEWSVTPTAARLEPGEIANFTTQLNTPPAGAAKVRLTFSAGRGRLEAPVAAS